MNIQINCDDFEVTDKIKAAIDKKISQKMDKLLTDFPPESKIANLHLEQLPHTKEYKVNIDMTLPGNKSIYATSTHKSLITAISEIREQLERQLEKYKSELSSQN